MAGQVQQKGFNDADLVDLLRALRNRVLSYGALPSIAPATTTSKIKQLGTTLAIFDGVPKSIATTDNNDILTPSASLVTGATQGITFRIEQAAAGTLTAKPGPIVPAGASDAIATYLPFAKRTAGLVTVGFLLIQGVFTPGTTAVTVGMCNDGDPDLLPSTTQAQGSVGLVS